MYSKLVYDGFDAAAVAHEIEERIFEELDYTIEAKNTAEFARFYSGHPFILVPDVVEDLCTRRVLVTDWVDGSPLRSSYDEPLAERNRLAEILFRFYNEPVVRQGLCNGDPHPGNALVTLDGRVAFVDFGLVRRLPPGKRALLHEALRSAALHDGASLKSVLERLGFIVAPDKIDDHEAASGFLHLLRWYVDDHEVTLAPGLAAQVTADFSSVGSSMGRLAKHQNVPPEVAFWVRSQLQCLGTLGQLRPRLNLHRAAREWIFDEPPTTELGFLHAAWRAER